MCIAQGKSPVSIGKRLVKTELLFSQFRFCYRKRMIIDDGIRLVDVSISKSPHT
ncbi:MAG: hypothetical protein IJT53_06025 [Prevotella sp.]|nr:hypothetical protein [Prevotella sp.]